MRQSRGGLNFGRKRRKFNVPLFREIISWVVEILIVILICAIAFLVVQRNQVFDANGSHIKLPFGEKN